MGVDVGTFVGAAEGDGDVAADADVFGLCKGEEGFEAGEGVGDCAVCVGFGEGVGGGGEDGDFGGEGR